MTDEEVFAALDAVSRDMAQLEYDYTRRLAEINAAGEAALAAFKHYDPAREWEFFDGKQRETVISGFRDLGIELRDFFESKNIGQDRIEEPPAFVSVKCNRTGECERIYLPVRGEP